MPIKQQNHKPLYSIMVAGVSRIARSRTPGMSLAISAAFLLCVLATGCNQKSVTPAMIVGDSMAPAFLGDHWKISCVDCQFPISFGAKAEELPLQKLVCPNCGCRIPDLQAASLTSSARVEVETKLPLERWDVVAFKLPEHEFAGIKRLIGMPSETIEIRDGEAYAEGELLRKPWSIQKQMRVPVFDSCYNPQSQVPGRWRSLTEPSSWQFTDSGILFGKAREVGDTEPQSREWDWLRYHHWRCCQHSETRTTDFPIEDLDAFNLSTSRDLNPMDDLFLELNMEASDDCQFGWRYYRGQVRWSFLFDCGKKQLKIECCKTNQPIESCRTTILPLELASYQNCRLEFSTFDSQLMLQINEEAVYRDKQQPREHKISTYPLEIGAASGQVKFKQIRIWRDIYYLPESPDQRMLCGPPDSLILLGDNVPVSVDSRNWQSVGVQRPDILGIVRKTE